jgi:hypothetical protein
MGGTVEIVPILAAVAIVPVLRMIGEPATPMWMLVLPAALSLYGLYQVFGAVRTPPSLALLAGTAAVSVGIGALRGIVRRDDFAFVGYTAVIGGLWALNLATKLGANLALHDIDPKPAGSAGTGLLLPVGLGLLSEGVIGYHGALGGHRPRWSRSRRATAPVG